MPIDPRLYQKYSGKMPGEAMNRFGESLARSAAQKSANSMRGPQSFLSTWRKWRLWASLIGSLIVLLGLLLGFVRI